MSDDLVLLPTGQCFTDAWEFLERRAVTHPSALRAGAYLLCHGICRNDVGTPFAHAWIEPRRGNEVITFGLAKDALIKGENRFAEVTIEKASFYKKMRAERVTRYTPKNALRQFKSAGYAGPWLPQYLAHVKDKAP